MTPAEKDAALEKMHIAARINPQSDLPNQLAYDEAPKRATQVFSDIDGLKYVNDTYGHDSGNKLIRAKAEIFKDEGTDTNHIPGDEFFHQFDDPVAAKEAMDRANQLLADTEFTFQLPDGTTKTLKGASFSYGVANEADRITGDKHPAEAALQSAKDSAVGEGRRSAERGAKPPQLNETTPQGQQNNRLQASPKEVTPSPIITRERAFPKSAEAAGLKAKDLTYAVNTDTGAVDRANSRIQQHGIDRVIADLQKGEGSKDDIVAGSIIAHRQEEGLTGVAKTSPGFVGWGGAPMTIKEK